MATLIVCPRCRGAVQPDATACPRCGLVLTGLTSPEVRPVGGYSSPASFGQGPAEATTVDYAQNGAMSPGGTLPYEPASQPMPGLPVRAAGSPPAAPSASMPMPVQEASQPAPRVVPRGAVELLPEESVAFQLGALYLTNKRVILLAPSVVRAAFLKDVDAVGTLTERSSGWSLFFGLLFIGLAAAAGYASFARAQFESNFPVLYTIEPLILAAGLAVAGLALLVMYFLWVKRTLFISVSGRPLITVSVTDWNSRKFAGMDAFVNAFFMVKDEIEARR